MREIITSTTVIGVFICLASVALAQNPAPEENDSLPEGAVQRLGTLALRYPGGIRDLCYLPDGRGVIAVGGRAEIWDLAEGQLQRTDEVSSTTIRSIEPNADGTALLVGDAAGDVHVWDLQEREVTTTIETAQARLSSAYYSPDETRVLTAGTSPPTIAEWDLATGEKLVAIEGGMHSFRQAIYGPDGRTAFADGKAGSGPILAHYDLQTGELLHTWHKDYYSHSRSLELSPDRERLLAGTRHSAQEWDVETYEMLGKFSGHHGHAVTSVAYCADPDQLLTGSRDGSIRRWDRHEAKVLLRWWPHEGHVTRIEVSPDGKWALSYGAGLVDERNVEDGTPRIVWERHNGAVNAVAAVPGGDRVVSGSTDETLRVWDTSSGESLLTIDGANLGAWALDVSPDGQRVAAGCKDGIVREFSLQDGSLLRELSGHRGYVRAVAYTPKGTHLLSSAGDGTVRAWGDRDTPVHVLDEHRGGVLALDVSPDGNYAVSGGRDGTVRYWALSGGRLLRTMTGHRRWVHAARFIDANTVVTGDGYGTIIVWDLETGEIIRKMEHGYGVLALAVHGGRIYATGWEISCWDAATGERLATYQGHKDTILGLTVTAAGRVVTASEDTTLLVWETLR
jgi:WD40 repeat protein